MKSYLAACALALATSAVLATPASAGPVGSGLGLTEAVAHRQTAQRTLKIAATGAACAAQAKAALRGHPGVSSVKHDGAHLHVLFRKPSHAEEQRVAVEAAVARACA